MRYNLAIDVLFVILGIAAAFSLTSEHPIISAVFYAAALLLIAFEHQIVEYVRSA